MKFLRVSGLHYTIPKRFAYEQKPSLSSCSYAEQSRAIFSHFFHYSNSLTSALTCYGYEAHEILYDAEFLQKKWAEENGLTSITESWQQEILVRQIQTIKPQILYLHNASALPASILLRRKELFPSVEKLVIFRGYPEIDQPLLQVLSLADILLVGSPILEKICREKQLNPHLFYHYFDDRILSFLKEDRRRPFTFIGTSGVGYGWNHQPRYSYLFELLKTTGIECWVDEHVKRNSWKDLIKRFGENCFSLCSKSMLRNFTDDCSIPSLMRKIAFNALAKQASGQNPNRLFPQVPLQDLFPKKCHLPVFGLEMYKILSASSVTFNKHTFAARGTVDNIRLFEATGVGTCLLTDSGSNISDLFEGDREIVTYSSFEECKEKLTALLSNEALRQSIAIKGQKRALRDHTALVRAQSLHELLGAYGT